MAKASPVPDYIIRSSKGEITAVEFGYFPNDDNLYLLKGHSQGDLQIWNLKTYRLSVSWRAHAEHRVQWVSWLSDDCIISQGRDGLVKFWKFDAERNPQCTDTLDVTCFSHCQCAVYISKFDCKVQLNECYLGIPQGTSAVDVVTVLDKKLIYKMPEANINRKLGTLMCFQFVIFDGLSLILGGYECGSIILWNLSNTQPFCILDMYDEPVMCLHCDSNFMKGLVGSASNKLVQFGINIGDRGPEMCILKTVTITNDGSSCIKFHPSNTYVAVATWDNKLRIFSRRKLKPLAVLSVHSDSIQSLAYGLSGSNVILAAASKDGRVSLWNLYNNS